MRRFCDAVLRGDRSTAAALVAYPLRVNDGDDQQPHQSVIRDKAAFLARWTAIFTPATVKWIAEAVPHDVDVHEDMAMLGPGVIDFDDKGARVINVVH